MRSVTFLLLVLEILRKYHKGDLAGHCPIYIYKRLSFAKQAYVQNSNIPSVVNITWLGFVLVRLSPAV